MRLTEKKVIATLRQHGYKLTPQRRAIIRTITSNQDLHTPAAIYERLHNKHINIGLVTIYRTLDILVELELICVLHSGTSCPSYTISAPGQHYHLICANCCRVIDFTSPDLTEVEQKLSLETGFRVDSHKLEFVGLCKACQKK